ncbi:unnamed protein product, partial [Ectocarpus sp. 12 AP-2014]
MEAESSEAFASPSSAGNPGSAAGVAAAAPAAEEEERLLRVVTGVALVVRGGAAAKPAVALAPSLPLPPPPALPAAAFSTPTLAAMTPLSPSSGLSLSGRFALPAATAVAFRPLLAVEDSAAAAAAAAAVEPAPTAEGPAAEEAAASSAAAAATGAAGVDGAFTGVEDGDPAGASSTVAPCPFPATAEPSTTAFFTAAGAAVLGDGGLGPVGAM